MLARAQKAGLKIVESPITWKEQSGGSVNMLSISKMFFGILKLKLKL